ncbi:MAG: A/G-specific adenine glycosylase [Armatimonadetes bacterium]|nr:A/G-specific adenine glycosylase [Armatimonadota bacterium]
MPDFQRNLLTWYEAHRRDLPWRSSSDPYSVWVSEIMLQQTTVAAVIPFFERWMARFPKVEVLAAASEDEVLTYWQGLGYYSRARNIHQAAEMITDHGWPDSVEGLRALPGIGAYTAGAVGSIAFGWDVPLVDGNVERVFARLTVCYESGSKLNRLAWDWAHGVLAKGHAGDWNQALMELGATVCRPVNPSCVDCPVSNSCFAFASDLVNELPVPKKKTEWVELRHIVVVPICEGKFGVRRVPEGRWWQGMWEFPREEDSVPGLDELAGLLGSGWEELGKIKHVVTKHKITVRVFIVRLESEVSGLEWVAPEDLDGLALPAPTAKIARMLYGELGLLV